MLRILIFIAFFVSTSVIAGELAENKKDFYSDRERGWYFYEFEPLEQEQKPEEEKESGFKKPIVDWEAVWTMHPKEFSKLFDDLRAYALMFPTEENVAEYYRMNRVYLDRSRKFQEVSTMVAQTHPELSRENTFPVSTVGQEAYRSMKKEEVNRILRQNADNYALLYFYSPECGYCAQQSPILQYFIEDTGWTIKPVDITENQAAALTFDIKSTPSLVMIKKNSTERIRISSGLLPLTDIKERVVRSIK